MRVLHLSSERSWRGGEQQMAYLIKELQQQGVQSHVAARCDSEFARWCRHEAIPFIELSFKNDFDISSALSLKQYCRKQQFDVMHLHSSRGHGIAFLAAVLGNKTPMVLSRRVDFALKKDFLSRAKYNYRGIKKIICVSEKIKEIISSSIKYPERFITIYDGIDLKRFSGKGRRGVLRKELGIGMDEIVIGNVAALAEHKDYFTFLKTARNLTQGPFPSERGEESLLTKIKFLIVGDGPLKNEIEKKVNELNLKDQVFLLGFRSDLENVYADLDVLLYTSKEEGLGSALLDAMAVGVPVVATEAGGIPEIVLNEKTGLTAPVQDSEKLAKQVLRILNDIQLREKLVMTAKEFVKNFSKEKMAEKTLEVYKEVVGRN